MLLDSSDSGNALKRNCEFKSVKTACDLMNRESRMTDDALKIHDHSIEQAGDRGIAFVDILIILASRKKSIVFITFVVTVVVAGLSLLLPNKYTGRTQVLPPQSQSNSSALLGQLGSLGAVAGASMSLKNPNDMYVGIFNSRTISDNLIKRFDLQRVYGRKTLTDTRRDLAKSTFITSEKSGIIVVDVSDVDPKLAADLANGYVAELQKLTQVLAITEASQRRMFFENQLQRAKKDLSNAEVSLKSLQERTGVIQLSDQATSIIKSIAELRAAIAAKEVELGALRTFATRENSEYIRTENVIAGLKKQLMKLETGANTGNGDISVATNQVPRVGLEYIRQMRDVKYYETVFDLLAKQFELAKIDESKNSSTIQILDVAVVPEKKSGPARMFFVLGAFLATLFLTMCWALVTEGATRRPGELEKWTKLRRHLLGK